MREGDYSKPEAEMEITNLGTSEDNFDVEAVASMNDSRNVFDNQQFIKQQYNLFLGDIRSIDDDSKRQIQQIIASHVGMFEENDFRIYATFESISYLLNDSLKSETKRFLEEYLQISESKSSNEIVDFMSHGYHIFDDKSAANKIFSLEEGANNEIINWKKRVPKSYSVEENVECDKQFCYAEENMEIIRKQRSRDLGNQFKPNERNYYWFMRPGYTLITKHSQDKSVLTEFRKFKVTLSDSWNDIKLTDDFKEKVERLPDVFNDETKLNYTDFFNEFGHCVIKSAYGGGSLETKGEIINRRGGSYVDKSDSVNDDIKKKWRYSIMVNPVMLHTELKLAPISEVAAILNKEKSIEIQKAIQELTNDPYESDDQKKKNLGGVTKSGKWIIDKIKKHPKKFISLGVVIVGGLSRYLYQGGTLNNICWNCFHLYFFATAISQQDLKVLDIIRTDIIQRAFTNNPLQNTIGKEQSNDSFENSIDIL